MIEEHCRRRGIDERGEQFGPGGHLDRVIATDYNLDRHRAKGFLSPLLSIFRPDLDFTNSLTDDPIATKAAREHLTGLELEAESEAQP